MNKMFLIFSIFLLCILSVNIIIPAHAIYLDAVINTKEQTAKPTFKFEKSLSLQYPEGSKLADILKGKILLFNLLQIQHLQVCLN